MNKGRYPIRLSQRMLPADALFWYAEGATPQMRPLVGTVLLLDRAPHLRRLRASIERLIQRVPRLRQRVVEPWHGVGAPTWEDHRHFELDYHLREVLLPEPATQRHLLDFMAAVFASPLDHLRPLWEAYLIEGLHGGRAAFFFKAHHSIVDGVGSLALFDALTDSSRKATEPIAAPARTARGSGAAHPDGRRSANSGLWDTASGVTEVATRALRDPWATFGDLSRLMRSVNGVIADLRATKPIADPIVRDSEGIGRYLELVHFSLPQMRRIKGALGVSLNDVVLTAVAGALGRYHDRHRKHVDALHCMVPINLRQEHERELLGNRVGVFNVTLPVGERSPLLRLAHIHAQTRTAKGDRRGTAYPFLMGLASLLPRAAFRALSQQAVGRFHLICTNIPGPKSRRYLAGARIDNMYPFAPLLLGAPLSVALLSYGDTYAVGLDIDPAALPYPESLGHHLAEAAAELSALTKNPTAALPRRGPVAAGTTRKRRGPAMADTDRPRRGVIRSV